MNSDKDEQAFPHYQPAAYTERTGSAPYGKCHTQDCGRLVTAAVLYCCAACSEAAAGRYEIDLHSPGCDQRMVERWPAAG